MWISCWVVRVTKTEAETAAMVETAVRAATLPEDDGDEAPDPTV